LSQISLEILSGDDAEGRWRWSGGDQAKPPAGWARTDLTPVTMPQLAGGRLVFSAEGGGGIQVVGLDPKTGKTVWRDNASPGDTTAGVSPTLEPGHGEHKSISPETAAWCGVGADFKTQVGYPNGQGGKAYERSGFSGYQPCDALGDYTSSATTVPSFAGITVDGLTVTSNSSEVAAVPAGSA
jgi:hypothetical protein